MGEKLCAQITRCNQKKINCFAIVEIEINKWKANCFGKVKLILSTESYWLLAKTEM